MGTFPSIATKLKTSAFAEEHLSTGNAAPNGPPLGANPKVCRLADFIDVAACSELLSESKADFGW
jgi:hypothetical protein